MNDTEKEPRRRNTRDRSNEYQIMLSVPASINERALAYREEFAPHLSQVAFWNEAMIFYLDSKGAPYPKKKEKES